LLGEGHDRVTIYRTLSAFLEKGLIHKVPGDTDATQFALCSGGCNAHEHQDDHVHFKCRVCQRSECLTELAVPEMNLPEGYGVESSNLLLEGVCRECRVA
ncbi:MAG: transcriptional repressor, partial [Bacteroidota bacterium]